MKWSLLVLFLLSLFAGLGVGILHWVGYFDDVNVARRALQQRGLPAEPASMFLAVERDDAASIALLAEAGFSPDLVDDEKNTPLHVAVDQEKWTAAGALLALDAPLNRKNGARLTPLQIALQGNHYDFVGRLLRRGSDPNVRFEVDQPALIEAIRTEREETVRLLLEHGADPNLPNATGTTPLYLALRSSQTRVARLLLAAGSDPNGTTPSDTDLLAFLIDHLRACGYDEAAAVPLIGLLIDAGAEAQRPGPDGKRPLEKALEKKLEAISEHLLSRIDKVKGNLWVALNRSDFELARRLVEKGADVNESREDGETALNRVIKESRPDLVQHFLNHGADASLPGLEGQAVEAVSKWPRTASQNMRILVSMMVDLTFRRNSAVPSRPSFVYRDAVGRE